MSDSKKDHRPIHPDDIIKMKNVALRIKVLEQLDSWRDPLIGLEREQLFQKQTQEKLDLLILSLFETAAGVNYCDWDRIEVVEISIEESAANKSQKTVDSNRITR